MKKSKIYAAFIAVILVTVSAFGASGCGANSSFQKINCNHNYSVTLHNATVSASGVKVYTCTECGYKYTEVLPKLELTESDCEHAYEITVETATGTEPGLKTCACSKCGDVLFTEEIPIKETPAAGVQLYQHSITITGLKGLYQINITGISTLSEKIETTYNIIPAKISKIYILNSSLAETESTAVKKDSVLKLTDSYITYVDSTGTLKHEYIVGSQVTTFEDVVTEYNN